jgi:hypothetical protein
LYDPVFARALAKKLMENNQVKAYILLGSQDDPSSPEKQFVRIPNIVFLEDLVATGKAQVKWKKAPDADANALRTVKQQLGVTLSPEYHLKGISVDGVTADLKGQCGTLSNDSKVAVTGAALENLKIAMQDRTSVLISGSANKDVMTMLGGFREFQVMVFDKEASIKHDCLFWSRFDNPDHAESATLADGTINYDLTNIPPEVIQKGISPQLFKEMVKKILTTFYSSTIEYFNTSGQ